MATQVGVVLQVPNYGLVLICELCVDHDSARRGQQGLPQQDAADCPGQFAVWLSLMHLT